MKIAVTSTLPTIDACVGTKLRLSKYLLIIDLGTMEYEAMPNPIMALSGPAAGKLFAQQLLQKGISRVLANNCGSDILKSLGDVGIQVIGGVSGSVRSAVKRFKEMCKAETIILPAEEVQG